MAAQGRREPLLTYMTAQKETLFVLFFKWRKFLKKIRFRRVRE